MIAHTLEKYISDVCAIMEHERCQKWRTCQCACHRGRKLVHDLTRPVVYDECPF